MLVVLFAFLFVGVIADPWPGTCPNVSLTEDIDLNKFLGKWYMLHIHANNKHARRSCTLLNFRKDNSSFTVDTLTYYDGEGKEAWKESNKFDRAAGTTNDGQLVITVLHHDKVELYPIYILSTDYEEYALTYSCDTSNKVAVDATHDVVFMILIKKKGKLEGETLQKVENALLKYTSLTQNKPLAVNDFKFKDICNI